MTKLEAFELLSLQSLYAKLRADFGYSCNFLQYFKKDKLYNFPFRLKDLLR